MHKDTRYPNRKKSVFLLIMVGHDAVVDQTGSNVGDNNFCLTCYVGGNTLSNKCFTMEFQ